MKLSKLIPPRKTPDNAAIGKQVVKARGKITQAALAEQMDITAAYLCDLEYGRRNWTHELLMAAETAIAAIQNEG